MAKKILLVEDDPHIVETVSSRLKARGYDVKAARDGLQAVKKAHQERPDLIILDVRVPAGNGISVAEKLKLSDDTALIPVIFITGYASKDVRQKALEVGAKGLLTKPFAAEDLLPKVRSVLGEVDEKVAGNKQYLKKLEEWEKAVVDDEIVEESKVRKNRILVVEDEAHALETLKDRLEFEGYEIVTAEDGETALSRAGTEKPDLIILDIMLPKVDGFEVCRLLKSDEELRHIRVIMLTARAQDTDINLGKEIGADAYITKPFDFSELIKKIKEVLS